MGAILFGVVLVMLTAAVYVALGLRSCIWGAEPCRLFAVGGILCGIASIVLNPYKGED